ncbi:ABC transporter related [Catenulispora acidiphila DSM 44928]|uniref:ABC transporter related n=1 Tax=Catenulispora acidiphila (strain DSM 44928 / JCM 14897 / NBRC 102108 / NRRL B-24433 / ID139908) TaxID=479433 RepID=C7PZ55_CATAD|nr:ABC transporter ATP-binding protein [Catenulispora acidiphila]ACU69611.1 ABC transporter related [Catenulispora acidiphila DSM 44928]
MNAVVVEDLTMRYRGHTALDGVDLTLAPDTIHGLLGRNGAGKTTLMRILTGQEFETSGRVEVFGQPPRENPAVLNRVCFIREAQKYPQNFKVREAFAAAAIACPGWDQAYADRLVQDFDLPLKRQIKKLSRGQLSAVGIIIGLAARAPLTLFDEPYLGLDAVARHVFYDRLLEDFSENPRTVILSTHLIDEVADLVEHVVLIDHGTVLMDADADGLRGRAVSVSGPAEAVAAYVEDAPVLHRSGLGGQLRVALAERPERPAEGVSVDSLSLQELIVLTTNQGDGK